MASRWMTSASARALTRNLYNSPSRHFSNTRTAFSAVRDHDRQQKPLRMAVVGSGPAGFYTAYRVMSRLPAARVDMYESLPVPFGLVRYGVAPDHPEVKNCQDKFEEVAGSPNFTFMGNVTIGKSNSHGGNQSIKLSHLLSNYDAVLFAYGASRDKSLGIPGESTLEGIYSARDFVGWYNGLPECAHLTPDLTTGEEAVIIGQGNVALDVARMLLEDVDTLRKTDIAEHALETLSRSRVRRVHVVGRRGPIQAAFTIKEVRELMKIPHVSFHQTDSSLIPADLKHLQRAAKRLMEVLVKGSGSQVSSSSASKSWSLDYCLSPTAFQEHGNSKRVGRTAFQRTELSSKFDPAAQARLTTESVSIPSSVVFRSIGYKSSPLPGFDDAGILFDERRGIIMHDGMGRVLHNGRNGTEYDIMSEIYPGLYCAGWVKRGPTGVIATTMQDAFDTGDSIIQDWLSDSPFLTQSERGSVAGWEGIRSLADPSARVVHWQDWKMIDEHERSRGRDAGKPREKLTNTSEMLRLLS